MKLRLLAALSLSVTLGLPPRLASAQSNEKASAVELYDAAERLMSEGKTADACSKYGDSQRLDPQLGTLLHLADCLEKLGKTASAWAHWRDGVELAHKRGDPRAELARERAAALEQKLSRLTLEVTPGASGLEVLRDGAVVQPSLWSTPSPVDPGAHVIEARAAGKKPWRTEVEVAVGTPLHVTVPALEDAPAESGAPLTHAVGGSENATTGSGQRTLGLIVGGLGVVGLGVGTAFALTRSSTLDERETVCPTRVDCTQDEVSRNASLTEDARRASTMATIGVVAGAALLVTGVILFVTSPRVPSRAGASLSSLAVRRGGVGGATTLVARW